jgi:HEAT repeat protein
VGRLLSVALTLFVPLTAFAWLSLGRAAGTDQPAQQPEERKLLRDARPEMRLQAALALVKRRDVEAVPVLIDLLAEVPPRQRKPIEDALQELAGEWAPNLTLAGEDDITRRIRRDAWASWWQRTDGPALLEEFRKRTLSAPDVARVQALLRSFDDKSFRVREQAMADVMAYGRVVVPLLREALKGADLEKRRRAELCLQALARTEDRALPPVAASLVALRQPAGVVDVLLAFLPWTEDQNLAGEVQTALARLAVRDGKVDAALVRALDDSLPVRRAVAAEVLAGAGTAEQRVAVRKLLTDPDTAVRLAAAVALTYAGDRTAVPVLIDLAADLPGKQAWQAADILRQLAGAKAPSAEPGDQAAARNHYRAAWQAWWKEHGGAVNLAGLDTTVTHKARVTARASNSGENQPPANAFDGDRHTMWNAGDYAPQWLEADLGASTRLASIVLHVIQSPAGETTHEIWVSQEPIGAERAKAKLMHTFRGNTDSNQELKFTFPKGLFARYVQIRTTQSPSWVAWTEVELRVGRSRLGFVRE